MEIIFSSLFYRFFSAQVDLDLISTSLSVLWSYSYKFGAHPHPSKHGPVPPFEV